MLSPAQKKRLAELERESVSLSFERTKYTFDHSPKGVAEWDRLWARGLEIGEERKKLIGDKGVQSTLQTVSSQA